MTGAFDPLYIAARRSLLDCLDALSQHREALVLVGAQAIYIRVGEAEIAVSAYTRDADVMLDPALLATEPAVEDAMAAAGFLPKDSPGTWMSPTGIPVDLLVPAAVAGTGATRRGARLPEPHGNKAARQVKGLEAALVDNDIVTITALEPNDGRAYGIRVAGTAALLVAKLHKIGERADSSNRLSDKDAHDVFRILQHTPTAELSVRVANLCAATVCGPVTKEAVGYARELFGFMDGVGVQMLRRAVEGLGENPDEYAQACVFLVGDLLRALEASIAWDSPSN